MSHDRFSRHKLIAYHKPVGEICSRSDPEGRPSVFARLPELRSGRWILVGRLDYNTSGLLLFTTDGQLAHRLMHPSGEVEREYAVRILGEVDQDMLARLRSGVELEDGLASFDAIDDAGGKGANHWYHVVLKEGRRREVRRLWESQGVTVSRLIRIRYGTVLLTRSLPVGKYRDITGIEQSELMGLVGLVMPDANTTGRGQKRVAKGGRSRPTRPAGRRPKSRKKGGSRRD